MRSKKTKTKYVDPEYMIKQKAALRHKNRMELRLNDMEKAAVDEYCSRRKITSRSALLRQIIMERILTELGEDHPTLF